MEVLVALQVLEYGTELTVPQAKQVLFLRGWYKWRE